MSIHHSFLLSVISFYLNAHSISNQVLEDAEMNRAPILSLWSPEPRGSAVGAEAHSFLLQTFNKCL